jgi:hypothetical protein
MGLFVLNRVSCDRKTSAGVTVAARRDSPDGRAMEVTRKEESSSAALQDVVGFFGSSGTLARRKHAAETPNKAGETTNARAAQTIPTIATGLA